jgi:hypothetical protein
MASGRSSSDDRILEVIFDPEAPLLAVQEENPVVNGDQREVTSAPREVREMEVKAMVAAEEGRLDEALQLLNDAVVKAPDSASVYNNRAQVASFSRCISCDSRWRKLYQTSTELLS